MSPPAIEAELVLLKDNKFPVHEYASLGEFTKQVLDIKTKKSMQGLALRASCLQELEPCTGDKLPGSSAHMFAADLRIRQMCNPDSLSYAPVSLYELSAAPMILLPSRFAASSSGIRMAKAVTALLVKHDAVLVARAGAKEKLVDMQGELVELYAEFFLALLSLFLLSHCRQQNMMLETPKEWSSLRLCVRGSLTQPSGRTWCPNTS